MHIGEQKPVFYMSPGGNLRDPQPMQISGEAQELTQMVNSWPSGGNSRCRKKEIAADLLSGALGLQESLVRLGKIEAACKFVSRRSREQSSSFTLGEELGVEMGFRRFHAQGHQHGLRGVRNLRASRNCVEELKMVIGNCSLRRQNLVSFSPTDGDDVDEKSSVSRTPKLPSVGDEKGCKQRGVDQSSGYAAAEQQKKARNPNLIARIMGLEEAPSEISVPVGGIERRRCSRKRRPLSDLEMLELPLTEMLQETELFKGALKSAVLEVEKLGKDLNIEIGQASGQAKSQPPASELPEKMEKRAGKAVAEATEAAKSGKTKLPAASPSPNQKQLKKRASRTKNGKNNGVQKAAADGDTSQEKKSTESAAAQGSQPKKTSRKPEKSSVQVKNRVLILQTNTLHHGDRRPDKPAQRNHHGSAKGSKVMRAKPVEEPKPIITRQAEAPRSKQENRESSSTTSLCDLPLNGTDHQCIAGERADLTGGAERTDAEPKLSSPNYEDTSWNKPSFHCQVMPKRSHGGGGRNMGGPRHAESTTPTPVAAEQALERIKSLLILSSPSFLHSTQELFNLPGHERPAGCRSTSETEKKKKMADEYSKLLLDCAGERMSYRRRHLSEVAHHPLCTICSKGGVTRISKNDLVEEMGGEIQELDCGGRAGAAEGASGDHGLRARLEMDHVKCGGRGWANGAWEQGWNVAMAPVEEGDGVACDMETYVFEVLVQEITSDLLDGSVG